MKQKIAHLKQWQARVNWPRVMGVGFFVLILMALIYGFMSLSHYLQHEQQAKIKHVTVLGAPKYTSEQQIVSAIRRAELSRFFELDVNQIQKSVTELPWVASASVRKQWPDKLKVYVVEHQAIAIWNDDLLINKQGEVFQVPKATIDTSLPRLFGPEGSEADALHTFKEFSELLYLNNFELTSLALSERFSWQFGLSNGISLNLGRKEKLERVQRFINLYPYMLKRKDAEVESVDLRYDTGLAVSWKTADDKKLQQKNNNRKSKA